MPIGILLTKEDRYLLGIFVKKAKKYPSHMDASIQFLNGFNFP